jgi:hypothetical protein
VHADKKLTAFIELELAIQDRQTRMNASRRK